MADFVVVIPARFASERLPGKPLLPIAGRPMIQHVWSVGMESGAEAVVIATDDERIAEAGEAFGAEVCMTAPTHTSGTDRIAEVADIYDWDDALVVVNLQGDEPLMPASSLKQCARLLDDAAADIGTLASPLQSPADWEDPNVVKALVDDNGFALYFSRAAVPYARDASAAALAAESALHHHGIYGYRCGVLRRLVTTPPSALEQAEKLEQLRALQIGLRIRVGIPALRPGPGVDTADDLRRAEEALKRRN